MSEHDTDPIGFPPIPPGSTTGQQLEPVPPEQTDLILQIHRSQQIRRLDAPTKLWLTLFGAVGGLLLTLLLALLLPFLFWLNPFLSGLVIWVVCSVLVTVYLWGYRAVSEENACRPWQTIDNCVATTIKLPGRVKQGVLYLLTTRRNHRTGQLEYEYVVDLARRHLVYILRRLFLPIACFVVLVVLVVFLRRTTIPWLSDISLWRAVTLGFIICLLWALALYDHWCHVLFEITTLGVRVIIDPPAWLWFVGDTDVSFFPWTVVSGAQYRSRFFGKLLRYGEMSVSTTLQSPEDAPVEGLIYIPHPRDRVDEINARSQGRL